MATQTAAAVVERMVAEMGLDDSDFEIGIERVSSKLRSLEKTPLKGIDTSGLSKGMNASYAVAMRLQHGISALAAGANGDFQSMAMGVAQVGRAFNIASVGMIGLAAGVGWQTGKMIDKLVEKITGKGISQRIADAFVPQVDGSRSAEVVEMHRARMENLSAISKSYYEKLTDAGIDAYKKIYTSEEFQAIAKVTGDKSPFLNLLTKQGGARVETEKERGTRQDKEQLSFQENLKKAEFEKLSIVGKEANVLKQIAEANSKLVDSTGKTNFAENDKLLTLQAQLKTIQDEKKEKLDQIEDLKMTMQLEDERSALAEKEAANQAEKDAQKKDAPTISFGTAGSLWQDRQKWNLDDAQKAKELKLDATQKAKDDALKNERDALDKKEAKAQRQKNNELLQELVNKTGNDTVVK